MTAKWQRVTALSAVHDAAVKRRDAEARAAYERAYSRFQHKVEVARRDLMEAVNGH